MSCLQIVWAFVVAILFAMSSSALAGESAKMREARQHFEDGAKAYKLGDYERAIAEYKASYDLHPAPLLLYDLGQAYRKLGRFDLALHSYQQYLADASPESSHRQDAEDQVGQLKKLLEDQRTRQSAPPDGVSEPPPSPPTAASTIPQRPASTVAAASAHPRRAWYRSAAGWTLAVGGVAALAVGGGLLAHSSDLGDQAGIAPTLQRQRDLRDAANTYGAAGYSVLGIGCVAAAAAVIVFAVDAVRGRRQGVSVGMSPMPNGGFVSLGGAW